MSRQRTLKERSLRARWLFNRVTAMQTATLGMAIEVLTWRRLKRGKVHYPFWRGVALLMFACAVFCHCGLDLGALQAGRHADAGTMTPRTDGSTLPGADMAPWNPAMQAATTAGCKAAGYPLSLSAAACPVLFTTPGDITKNCGSGWALCADLPIALDRCNSVPWGFFASAARGGQLAPLPPAIPRLHCDWGGQNSGADERFLFGCGTTSKTPWTGSPCAGFTRAVSCGNGQSMYPTTWKCFLGSTADDRDWPDTTNPLTATDGVLCCKQ